MTIRKKRFQAYGMFGDDMTDDSWATFDSLLEAKEYALGRLNDPEKKEFKTVDGVEGWYLCPETDGFLIVAQEQRDDEWITTNEIEVTTKPSDKAMEYVGFYGCDDDELQNFSPEIWLENSIIHVYDNILSDIDRTGETEFVFIEQRRPDPRNYPDDKPFHVRVGNHSEIFATLEEAEVDLAQWLCVPFENYRP